MQGIRTLRLLGRLSADLDAAMYDWEDGEAPSDARTGRPAHGAAPRSGAGRAADRSGAGGAAPGAERLPVPA